MKRKIVVFLSLLFMFVFCGCGQSFGASQTKYSVTSNEGVVAIAVEDAQDAKVLLDVMKLAQTEEKLTFTESNGMIMSINGKENAADWSASWMLYTSDKEMSTTEYGTYEYEGQTLCSATLGAGALPVVDGEIYVWVYVTF